MDPNQGLDSANTRPTFSSHERPSQATNPDPSINIITRRIPSAIIEPIVLCEHVDHELPCIFQGAGGAGGVLEAVSASNKECCRGGEDAEKLRTTWMESVQKKIAV